MGLYPALIVALLSAGALGVLNGLFVTVLGISSFVATLGMLFVLHGVTLVMSHATPVSTPGTAVVGVNTFSQIFGAGRQRAGAGRPFSVITGDWRSERFERADQDPCGRDRGGDPGRADRDPIRACAPSCRSSPLRHAGRMMLTLTSAPVNGSLRWDAGAGADDELRLNRGHRR